MVQSAMAETIAQYTARIQSYIHGKDPVAVQRETYGRLAALLGNGGRADFQQAHGNGSWSIAEIMAHLADVEAVHTWRYRQILEKSGVALTAFSQDEWARLGDYKTADLKESLELFRLLRQKNVRMFERLTKEEWQRYGEHAERGRLTLRDLVTQLAGHDLNHLQQIEKLTQPAGQ